jgi:hypothetical protein
MKFLSPLALNRRRTAGNGILLTFVLVNVALLSLFIGGTMQRTANVSKLNERQRQYVENLSAAEAATEKIVSRMIMDFRKDGVGGIATALSSYNQLAPTSAENPFWTNYTFMNAQGQANKTSVILVTNWAYAALSSQFEGLWGYAAHYRVVSNVRNVAGGEQVTVAAQQTIQPAQIPIFQFAIFYNSLLEFTWAAPMTVRGRVHANGDIYTGSAWSLTFNSAVTATGNIIKKGWAGYSSGSMSGSITYKDTKATNVPTLSLPIGTNNSAASVREIIRMPTTSESMNSPMGTNRYYNKAEMVLLVSNSTVTAEIRQYGGFDASPTKVTWFTTNATAPSGLNYFLNMSNTFTDLRENKTIRTTQVDIGKYTRWAATNSLVTTKVGQSYGTNNVPNILYVADFRTGGTSLNAVRVTNAVTLPNRGLTIATPNPLYTWGNFNCPNPSHLNTTNTSQTKPASLISDAWTALSGNWVDALSAGSLSSRIANNTTVNAAIITGVVFSDYSDGTPFSGGAMNMPRLLEHWGNGSSTKLTLNTSLVNLFNSVYATANWSTPGTYYYAPIRDFNFDQNFKDMTKLPPGTPMLSAIIRGHWANPAPFTTSYAGVEY